MAMKPKMRFKPTILVATQATEKVVKSLNAFLRAKKNSIKRERRFYMFAFVILMFTLQIIPSFIPILQTHSPQSLFRPIHPSDPPLGPFLHTHPGFKPKFFPPVRTIHPLGASFMDKLAKLRVFLQI